MAEVTTMVLKVDLHCCKCYKKVKKVLCKFHEIRDQEYDEKQNNVTIKVVSCCPERMMQKIWCKGGKSIRSIEIKPPGTKQAPDGRKEDGKASDGKKEDGKASDGKKEDGKASDGKKDGKKEDKATDGKKGDGKKDDKATDGKKETTKSADPKPDKHIKVVVELPTIPKPQPKRPERVPRYGYPIPYGVCCRDCYEGRGGGPCQQLGYVCRYPCYCGCYGRPVFDSWGGCNRGYYSRCEIYCEENPSACLIM